MRAGVGVRTPFDVNKCASSCNLQNAYYISFLLHRLRRLCRRSLFCTAAVQVFSPVSLVFALHMIKIWNYKNRNRTVNRGTYKKTNRNQPQIQKWKLSQHYLLINNYMIW